MSVLPNTSPDPSISCMKKKLVNYTCSGFLITVYPACVQLTQWVWKVGGSGVCVCVVGGVKYNCVRCACVRPTSQSVENTQREIMSLDRRDKNNFLSSKLPHSGCENPPAEHTCSTLNNMPNISTHDSLIRIQGKGIWWETEKKFRGWEGCSSAAPSNNGLAARLFMKTESTLTKSLHVKI